MKLILCALGVGALLGGCAAVDPVPVPPPRFAAVQPPEVQVPRGATGAIYNAVQSDNMFGRGRNFQVGAGGGAGLAPAPAPDEPDRRRRRRLYRRY